MAVELSGEDWDCVGAEDWYIISGGFGTRPAPDPDWQGALVLCRSVSVRIIR